MYIGKLFHLPSPSHCNWCRAVNAKTSNPETLYSQLRSGPLQIIFPFNSTPEIEFCLNRVWRWFSYRFHQA
jgi:hypothetical protein